MIMQQKLDKLISDQQELKQKFQLEGRKIFKEVLKEFFEKSPSIKAIKWCQYTPYFNDGDTCVFGVNSPVFTNATDDDLTEVNPWGEYEGENEDIWTYNDIRYALRSSYMAETFEELDKLQGFDKEYAIAFDTMLQSDGMSDIMLSMFGDHVVVTATSTGIEVEELEHD